MNEAITATLVCRVLYVPLTFRVLQLNSACSSLLAPLTTAMNHRTTTTVVHVSKNCTIKVVVLESSARRAIIPLLTKNKYRGPTYDARATIEVRTTISFCGVPHITILMHLPKPDLKKKQNRYVHRIKCVIN